MRFEDKVAVVTGGGLGIGRAIALAFADEGADVVIYDWDLEAAEEIASKIKALGRQVLAIKCDVSNSRDVSEVTKNTLDEFKRIDILVNNAAVVKPAPTCKIDKPVKNVAIVETAPTEEASEALWDRVININLKGQFLCCQAIGRQMIKQGYGKIINIASTDAHVCTPGDVAYSASKGGVLQLTRSLAVEWAKYNINVNSVSPGTTLTPGSNRIMVEYPERLESRLKRVPLGRLNKPEDIANAVLFLASSDAANITGRDLMVDGGMTALHPGFI